MKTALVTGASRGIGNAISEMLAKKGYNLHLLCQKSIESLTAYAKSLSDSYGVKVYAHQADVSDYDALAKVFSEIDSLDVLVNNAGISYVGLLTDMSVEEWHNIVDVNLSSVFYTSKLSIPLMLKKHEGSIINISSVWGNIGASTEVAYSATKGGVNSFTKALAKELAPSNISVNAIACGFVDTDMNRHLSSEDLLDIRMQIPADRFASTDDIAAAVEGLLASSPYLTGQVITVDGGWT